MLRFGCLLALSFALAGCSGNEDEQAAATRAPATTTVATTAAGDTFARIPDIVDAVQPSVVAIQVSGEQGEGEGSGVIWSEDGVIVTNFHVVAGASRLEVVLADATRHSGRVRATDEVTDLAVVEVDDGDLPAAEFADRLPRVGELALAIGNPLGFEESVSAGIVSGLHREIPARGQTPSLVDLLQTDAAISPGNSGGALVDANGDVIGINVAYIPPTARAVSIGFAIPSQTVREVVGELLEDGQATHAYIGIRPQAVTAEIAGRLGLDEPAGALVLSVDSGTPAAQAGLREGDVIVRFGDRDIRIVEDLFAELRDREPGDEVTATIVRAGERQELDLTLAQRP